MNRANRKPDDLSINLTCLQLQIFPRKIKRQLGTEVDPEEAAYEITLQRGLQVLGVIPRFQSSSFVKEDCSLVYHPKTITIEWDLYKNTNSVCNWCLYIEQANNKRKHLKQTVSINLKKDFARFFKNSEKKFIHESKFRKTGLQLQWTIHVDKHMIKEEIQMLRATKTKFIEYQPTPDSSFQEETIKSPVIKQKQGISIKFVAVILVILLLGIAGYFSLEDQPSYNYDQFNLSKKKSQKKKKKKNS